MSDDVLSAAEQASLSTPVRRFFKESSVSAWNQNAGETPSSKESIPGHEYQINEDE